MDQWDGKVVLDTCYGDLFSVSWMENAETVDLTAETLQVGRLGRETGIIDRWTIGCHDKHYQLQLFS